MDYKRVVGGTRCSNGCRGFRLNIRRLSIHSLRTKFIHLFKVLNRWRKSYARAVRSIRKGLKMKNHNNMSWYSSNINGNGNNSKSRLIGSSDQDRKKTECGGRLRSLARTNSFYTEAIADCLEFIKRNSLSVDDPLDQAAPIAAALR